MKSGVLGYLELALELINWLPRQGSLHLIQCKLTDTLLIETPMDWG